MASKYKVTLCFVDIGLSLNHELAIARIDRMGQTRATEGMLSFPLIVLEILIDENSFLLLCRRYVGCIHHDMAGGMNESIDTVEKNILDLAARQGLSLYTKDNSAGSLNVTSFAVDSQKKLVDSPTKSGKKGQPAQKGDFIFKCAASLSHLWVSVTHIRLGWTTCWRSCSRTCSRTSSFSYHRTPAARKCRLL